MLDYLSIPFSMKRNVIFDIYSAHLKQFFHILTKLKIVIITFGIISC